MSAVSTVVATLARENHARWVAALARRTRDIELAQECVQDALMQALRVWGESGLPANPAAWVALTAKRKAIDALRRRRRDAAQELEEERIAAETARPDQLGLLFAVCHPAIEPRNQVALFLTTLGGLDTASVAALFLQSPDAMGRRLSRVSSKIRDAGVPFEVPAPAERSRRLAGVLAAIYLLFTEGSVATRDGGDALCAHAIALGQAVHALLPDEPEVLGLLALMRLHHARRDGRLDGNGRALRLAEQDRTRWRADEVAVGEAELDRAMAMLRPGPYQIQAAIAALHAQAETADQTDWSQITALYGSLLHYQPSPVVELNAAVALTMSHGAEAGLQWVERIAERGVLGDFHRLDAVRGDLLERLGRRTLAAQAFRRAAMNAPSPEETAFLSGRAQALQSGTRRRRAASVPRRIELTDWEWARIRHLFPNKPPGRGRPPRPDREMLSAVLWVLGTGSPWRKLPPQMGPWRTAYHRFRLWETDGRLAQVVARLATHPGARAWQTMPTLNR